MISFMYQFFVNDEQINNNTVTILGPDVNHIKNVLRMKRGEEINVSNGHDGREYRCGILEYTNDSVICELRFIKEDSHELPNKVFLFQGLPKGDKMESIIQKNVELGVFEIIPVKMRRCVMKIDEKKVPQKIARWQEIAVAAAKQSKRGIIPKITNPMTVKEALIYAKEHCDIKLLPYEMAEGMEYSRKLVGGIKDTDSVAIFIGPEGGFDPEEVAVSKEAGFSEITLGKRILRTETAGMFVMSVLSFLFEK